MPTPVATAKQCLTPEAAHALDEAVSVARVRNHAQTTSLHAVSAFLSLPSSPLRDACFHARNAAFYYSSASCRAQIRALDFSLSLSLDRSPSCQQRVDEPPISNSLMAAIKRSQANQRRQPESFCYKQEQGKEQLGTSGVRVEIQNLIVAILDDPIVSRVFNEAGFSSFDVKLAMVRPLQGFWRYNTPRQRIHRNPNPNPTQFKFPFSGEYFGDDDFRRVGEVLGRKQGRNPLLFGVCAYDALLGFVERCRNGDEEGNLLPLGLKGVRVVSVESEILRFGSEEVMKRRFEELGAMVEGCCGPGLVVSFGDLKAFVKDEDEGGCLLRGLVAEFTRLIEVCRYRVWLIGCATYEVYLKFLNRFPCVDKDWDLQPLAITSMKSSKAEMCFKSSSLMGSFVPFAGFFPTSSDLRGTLRNTYQLPTRSDLYSEKHAQEVSCGSGYNSVADQCQTTLPSWLRMAEISKCNRSDTSKAKEDALVLRTTMEAYHSTLDDTRQNFHSTTMEVKTSSGEERARIDNKSCHSLHASDKGSDEWSSLPNVDHKTGPLGLTPENKNSLFSLFNRPSKIESHSLSSGASVATDLVLGLSTHPRSNQNTHLHTNDFKSLFEALIGRIGCQEEAIRIISQTISHTRTSNGKLKGSRIRGDIWMNFIGSDTFGMKKTALALAEVVCGSKGNLIHIDLSSQDSLVEPMVDLIASRLIKTPLSVIFLENLQCAHQPHQKSLLHAIRSGKFSESHGREVGIGNAIFLLSFVQDRVANAKPWPMQIIVSTPITAHHNNSVVSLFNKRKLQDTEAKKDLVKRPNKGLIVCLDLNLPADEFASCAWLEELSTHVDVTAVFKTFDYEALAKKTSGLIQGCFSKSFCSGCLLEIDPQAMDQVLAGARLLDGSTEVEDWLENVVSKLFAVARDRYHNLVSHCVVKLASIDGSLYREEEKETCEWLPSKMIIHCQP